MRFYRVQDIVLVAAAAVGLAVMLLSGATGPWIAFAAPPAFVLALLTPRTWMETRRWQRAWTAAAVVVFAAEVAAAASGTSVLTVSADLAVYFQIHKLFHRTSSRDHEQIALLALAHIAFATIVLTGLRYAALLVAFVVVAPLLLSLGYLRKEIEQKYASPPEGGPEEQTLERVLRTRRIATPGFVGAMIAMSVPLLLMTALFFVALPRLGFGLLARSAGGSFVTGFSDRLVLGDLVPLADDRTPVMRVEFPDGAPDAAALANMRFRGTTFDRYHDRVWLRTARPDPGAVVRRGDGSYELLLPGPRPRGTFRLRILQEPLDPRLLFLPAGTVALHYRDALPRRPGPRRDPLQWRADGAVEYRRADDEGVLYEVDVGWWPDRLVRVPGSGVWSPDAGEDDPYLAMPANAQGIAELARSITEGIDDARGRADALAQYLRTELRYGRGASAEAGSEPVEDFLFRWKEGYCEHFSSAMTLLARSVGLRARNVAGFLGGYWNEVGGYLVVRQRHAHSWTEIELPGEGWVIYDATPPAEGGALERTGGVFGWIRDLIDALQAAWQRHVLAFDLKQQVGILSAIGASFRAVKNAVVRIYRENRIVVLLGVAVILTAIAAWALRRRVLQRRPWLRRRRGEGPLRLVTPDAIEARRLLADLERVLRGVGIERAPHEAAERLCERAGLRAASLGEVTGAAVERYHDARFGLGTLTSADRRTIVRGVARAAR